MSSTKRNRQKLILSHNDNNSDAKRRHTLLDGREEAKGG